VVITNILEIGEASKQVLLKVKEYLPRKYKKLV